MQKTVYEDYKYCMQDTEKVYVGCKYTFQEFLEEDSVNFKLRMVINQYVLPHVSPEDTLESHLYYLAPDSFLVKIYDRMKMRIKVNVIEEKRHLIGGKKKEYVTKQMHIDELVKMTPAEKEEKGLAIQEFCISKLALLSL